MPRRSFCGAVIFAVGCRVSRNNKVSSWIKKCHPESRRVAGQSTGTLKPVFRLQWSTSGKAIWREARNGHGEIGVLLYELVAQTVGLRIVRHLGKLAHERFHSGSLEACTGPGTRTRFARHLDIDAERVSTGALVVVKEFTLNRCPFQ